jgi:hypothetical protein
MFLHTDALGGPCVGGGASVVEVGVGVTRTTWIGVDERNGIAVGCEPPEMKFLRIELNIELLVGVNKGVVVTTGRVDVAKPVTVASAGEAVTVAG